MAAFLLYGLLCVFMAGYDDAAIFYGKPVNHIRNGAIHLGVALSFGFFVHPLAGVSSLLFGRVVFDVLLNVMRFGVKGIGYVSPAPSSVVDKLEKAVFKNNGILPKLLYTALFIALQFIY